MPGSFDRFAGQIAAAGDDAQKKQLLAEIARIRATSLGDLRATRAATWAISNLHAQLDDDAQALKEANMLVSLCQTTPLASDEEDAAARSWLASLGGKATAPRARRERPERKPRERRERPERPERKPRERDDRRPSPVDAAIEDGKRGRYTEGLRALRGKKGTRAELTRAWLQLSRALAAEDEAALMRDLKDLSERLLGKITGVDTPDEAPAPQRDDKAEPPRKASTRSSGPLAALIGEVPARRRDYLAALDSWREAHPDRADELAAAALEDHVAESGARSPAPWLVGTVGAALASGDAPRTRATLDRLKAEGAYAASPYGESPFEVVMAVLGARGAWEAGALRRGVLSRGEPADRKLWTLRLSRGADERMVVVAPQGVEAYDDALAGKLASRIARLSNAAVLAAPGEPNGALRARAAEHGIHVIDGTDAAAIVAALDEVEPTVQAPATPADKADKADNAAPEPKPRGPSIAELQASLAALLKAEAAPLVDQLRGALDGFRRPFKAIQTGEELLEEGLDEARIGSLIEAVMSTLDGDERLPGATTLAIRAAARGGQATRRLLVEGDLAERLGGAGIDAVIEVAAAASRGGWHIHRALRGVTRRERREQPVLDTLADSLDGLWRLLVRREVDGETVNGEVWVLASLPPEGRAGVPQLLLSPHQRVVVCPIDADLLAWYATLDAPAPIGWTGEEGEAVRAELEGWVSDSSS